MKRYFLQLIYELHQVVGESIREIFEITICMKLTSEEGPLALRKDKLLNTLKRNIFYKPPSHDVVEVTPVSYALATNIICC